MPILRRLADELLPVNSQRRMFLRVFRDIVSEPRTIFDRFHRENLANFRRFTQQTFKCPICGASDRPLYDFPNVRLRREHHVALLRETLQCRHCFASMRQRTLAHTLLQVIGNINAVAAGDIEHLAKTGIGALQVLDTDAFSAISTILQAQPSVYRCSYLPDREWGEEISPRYFNIDLQAISFPDNFFDVVLSSDVMEHVRNCRAAHEEIHRILKPGGTYIFTVPFEKSCTGNIELVDTSTDKDVFLCPPQYHGDPLSGGILAYRIFGWGLLEELRAVGFETEYQEVTDDLALILAGDVIVARKPLAASRALDGEIVTTLRND